MLKMCPTRHDLMSLPCKKNRQKPNSVIKRALKDTFKKIHRINPWHVLWIAVVASELFTYGLSSIVCRVIGKDFSYDIRLIGGIDAFFVCLVISFIIIKFVTKIRQTTIINEELQREIEVRRQVEAELQQTRDELENRVKVRTGELLNANQELHHEIAARIEIQKELAIAIDDAEKANKTKSEFLANMSHEIRTPLNGIIGFTGIIMGMNSSLQQQKFMGLIKSSSERLLIIVNDILDFSKIEAGKLELETTTFNLYDTLTETLTSLTIKAREKALALTWSTKEETPLMLMGDPGRLSQILVNLVYNAIKFTEKGEIQVSVEVQEQTTESVLLHFAVRDTGIGVPCDRQKLIFNAFSQEDGSHTRKHSGTGLGLTISSQLVKMMGGNIWMESEALPRCRKNNGFPKKHKGSTFHFTTRFRLVMPSDQARYEQGEKGGNLKQEINRNLRILLAEDDLISRTLAEEIIKQRNWQVTPVRNGREALAALATNDYDLILMDVQMPEMDGFEATATIRKKEKEIGGNIPIIAMTAHALKGDREKCLCVGMNDYISKPIKPEELFAAIERQQFASK